MSIGDTVKNPYGEIGVITDRMECDEKFPNGLYCVKFEGWGYQWYEPKYLQTT